MDLVKFDFKSAKEAEKEFEKLKGLKAEIEAVERLGVALALYEHLAEHPEVTRWAVVFEKSYYNDDGLYEGAYADYLTKEKREMASDGDEYAYPDDTDEIQDGLNSILTAYHQGHGSDDSWVFPHKVYDSGPKGFERFAEDFAGKEYFARWRAQTEGRAIGEATPKAKKGARKGPGGL